MAYTRAEDIQIDLWDKLGSKGWTWENLMPYYLKSEKFQVPNRERLEDGKLSFKPEDHGKDGPLLTGWVYGTTNSTLGEKLNATFESMGVPWNADVNGGHMVGYTTFPSMINQELNIREDAARAYYFPVRDQKNLHMMLKTQARRIVWKKSENGTLPTADGVEVTDAEGKTQTLKARKEVILSAGALISPQLLELSGVGNPAILSAAGVEPVVDLPTVGENLQDQMNNGLQFEITHNFTETGKNGFVAYPTADQVFGNKTAEVAARVKAALPGYAQQVVAATGNVTRVADLEAFFAMQYELIFGAQQVPIAEVLLYQQDGVWDTEYWGLLPFSRGNVHIGPETAAAGAGVGAGAVLNPNYHLLDWDLTQQAGTADFIRRLYTTAPFADVVGAETVPGLAAVPSGADDAAWGPYLKKTYRSNFHPVGTAAMMPRAAGGVVDAELKVYGTANVRVVDASVLPFQVCGHLVSTLFAVAERASDLIKASA